MYHYSLYYMCCMSFFIAHQLQYPYSIASQVNHSHFNDMFILLQLESDIYQHVARCQNLAMHNQSNILHTCAYNFVLVIYVPGNACTIHRILRQSEGEFIIPKACACHALSTLTFLFCLLHVYPSDQFPMYTTSFA